MNDAPALARANVSVALASDAGSEHGGAALAQSHADFIVTGARLEDIGALIDGAHRSLRILRQNTRWAAGYTAVAALLAAAGLFTPAVALAGTAVSAAAVVANALRAARP
jgi:Cu2+-exporting ATPase